MDNPLVTVICLSYNHERFVTQALESVISQTYKNIQIIAVDDASTDDTQSVIREYIKNHHEIIFLPLHTNLGNCKAFNRALQLATGRYIIDMAADDIMMPDKIERHVKFFESTDRSYGVVFTDAEYIDERGNFIRRHFDHLFKNKLIKKVPEGEIYKDVIKTYFIPSQTMMSRTEVFQTLDGYDEDLAYEDFDFIVRASHMYKCAFDPEVTMKIRVLKTSMSRKAYQRGDKQLHSTYLVCKKAAELNRSDAEDSALAQRVRYEIRHSVLSDNFQEAELFYGLLKELGYEDFMSKLWINLGKLRLPLSSLRDLYHRWRFGK